MVLKINGIDITPYIAYGGFKRQRNDVDGPKAGRLLNSEMRRNRVATKIRLDVSCRPLTNDEAAIVLNAIQPEFVTVEYYDVQAKGVVQKTMYSNNVPATYAMKNRNGIEYWGGITFPLIEK